MRTFHHTGVITDERHSGELYVEQTKVWITNPDSHPYRIEYLRFEPDSPVTGPVRNQCHTAYTVDNLDKAIEGQRVLLGPFDALEGLRVVFVEQDGAVVEFMEFSKGRKQIS
ncbi:MAG TPA: hypothetical protein VGQ81_00870 [Acidobacteriota bacterium]|jgi:hypothetical protein|nr:hypothetical protein [Acidobacteriota bacterium]